MTVASTLRRCAPLAACAACVVLASTAAAGTSPGTNGHDVMTGTAQSDTLHGRGGNDQLTGGAGHDTITGGKGRDLVSAGPGNDVINVRDGHVDGVICGKGNDVVKSDPQDVVSADCEIEGLALPSGGPRVAIFFIKGQKPAQPGNPADKSLVIVRTPFVSDDPQGPKAQDVYCLFRKEDQPMNDTTPSSVGPCAFEYPQPTDVSLTATGLGFVAFGGACASVRRGVSGCQLHVDKDTVVTVTYDHQ